MRVLDLCEDANNIYVVLELMRHGTLTQMLAKIQENHLPFNERDCGNLIYQILLAMNFLHKQNVVHRDLKLDNIMIDLDRIDDNSTTMVCKVTDFGFAKALDPNQKETLSLGTPLYMSPELVLRKPYNTKVDIWALGVIVHVILTGIPPFNGRGKQKIFQSICKDALNLDLLTKYYQGGRLVKDFLRKCLAKNAEERATAEELLEHPWIKAMVIQEAVEEEMRIDIALNMYTFKRSSLLQSSVIAFLSRLKSDDEELAQLRKVFMQLNTSKTGYLTAEELRAGTENFKDTFKISLGKNSKYEPDWDKLVKCIDVDNDKKIGFDEFVTAASDRHRLIMGEGHLRQAFDILDGDRDGMISTEELKQAFAYGNMGAGLKTEKLKRVDDDQWDELLKGIDKNGDGKIDFDEF